MKISALEVEGFGVWTGLKLGGLSEGLNVFFGPNEAGKTTLMQFVRSVLYGFTAERRRYLPPLRGGPPGGSIYVVGPNGSFQVSRYQNDDESGFCEQVTLSAADGTRQGEHLLRVLMCNIDEAIFNHVFAVGLQELQELGTLSDTEAASLLYRLTAGLDRVALVDVVRELEASRSRLLCADDRPSQVSQLVCQGEKLRGELDQLDDLTRRYLRLVAERDQLGRETSRLEEQAAGLQHEVRVLEIAMAVGDRWQRRRHLDEQLLALGPMPAMPDRAIDRLDAIDAGLTKRQEHASQLKGRWEQLRAEAARLKINQALWRLAPRVEALAEQESWIGKLQCRVSELEHEITDLEAQLSAEHERFGLRSDAGADAVRAITSESLVALRPPARPLRQCRQRIDLARQQAATARQTAKSLADQIRAGLGAQDNGPLVEAMDRTGNLVSQLRRRLQIDERLEQMDCHQVELEEQGRRLLGRQVLPAWTLIGLGGVFVVSVVLLMAGLFMPSSITGWLGWPMALMGLAGLGTAVGTKFLLERSVAHRLEACQKQMTMLQLQVKQAQQERDALEGQLPAGEGSAAGRLKAAERRLAELEELAPLDARRQAAEQDAEAAGRRARQAETEFHAARRGWREALARAGLPEGLSPKQVRQLAGRCDHLNELRRRLEHRNEEYEQRCRELEALTARIAQLASAAGLSAEGGDPIEQVRTLTEAIQEQEARLERRQTLRDEARQLRRRHAKNQGAVRRLKRRRRELFRQVGVEDDPEFRQLAVQVARAETLRRERESLSREIEAAVGSQCSEEAIRRELEGDHHQGLEDRCEQLKKGLQAAEGQLQERFEKRGRLVEQLNALAEDRSPITKRLELSMVEKRLEEAIHRWRVLAVTGRILKTIRTTYEQERQPETLQEASGYLTHLTHGRYGRVWTPLDRDILLVDDSEGKSLPVELLSRGVREQLFLCIRLALASCFARRGAQLPMVLDDVLVNFDVQRAKAAASLLRDFAAAGHQVLVFTCHEHIVKLFGSLRVPVNRLPDNAEPAVPAAASRKSAGKRRKRKPQPQQPPRKLVAESDEQPPQEEILEAHNEEMAAAVHAVAAQAEEAPDDELGLWEEPEAEEAADTPAPEDDLEPARDEDDDEDETEGEQRAADDEDGEYEEEEEELDDEEEQFEDEDDEDEDEEDEDEEEELDDEEDEDEDDYEDDLDEAEAA